MNSSNETVLLTGATGFLGSHLLEELIKENYSVVIVKRSFSNTWRINHLLDQVKLYNIDEISLKKVFQDNRINTVIHTACSYGRKGESLSEIVTTNVLFGIELLELAVQFNTDTFFNTDTLQYEYLNRYTLSKKQFVEWLKAESVNIRVINLKLEHMYGPKDDEQKFIPWIITQLHKQVDEIQLTEGEQKRDFIFVEDVVSAYMIMLKNYKGMQGFTKFDVGTGELVTVRNFVEEIKHIYEKLNKSSSTKLNFGALPYRSGEPMQISVDNSKLVEMGWNPKFCRKKAIEISIKGTL